MDIRFIQVENQINIKVESVHGMLWLQTHFDSSSWESIASKEVLLSKEDAILLSSDAEEAGLLINIFPELSTSHIC